MMMMVINLTSVVISVLPQQSCDHLQIQHKTENKKLYNYTEQKLIHRKLLVNNNKYY
jgi:hypothetical protein